LASPAWRQAERQWTPLNDALTPSEAKQFAWRAESGTIQSYRHIETGRHLHIEGRTGQFYDQDRDEINAKEALDHAMPARQEHSHSLDVEHEHSIGYGLGLGL